MGRRMQLFQTLLIDINDPIPKQMDGNVPFTPLHQEDVLEQLGKSMELQHNRAGLREKRVNDLGHPAVL